VSRRAPRSRASKCWVEDSANRNIGRARTPHRVREGESEVHRNRSPAAECPIRTFRPRDASRSFLRACAFAARIPWLPDGHDKFSSSLTDAARDSLDERTRPKWPERADLYVDRSIASPTLVVRWRLPARYTSRPAAPEMRS